jgi:hypothetical protein
LLKAHIFKKTVLDNFLRGRKVWADFILGRKYEQGEEIRVKGKEKER